MKLNKLNKYYLIIRYNEYHIKNIKNNNILLYKNIIKDISIKQWEEMH